jgi:hypothetical protein
LLDVIIQDLEDIPMNAEIHFVSFDTNSTATSYVTKIISVTGMSGSSHDNGPAIQVQTLNGLMDTHPLGWK